ncbi:MAG: hypothetical protein QQN42_07895 [Nitrosopumilus sp.]
MKDVIEQLRAFFDQDGWPMDIDENKLWDRGTISDDIYKLGWKIVEIERHRGVLGSIYTPGLPMNAFQTYWTRYAVHLETGKVEELSEKDGDVTIDLHGLVDEELDNCEFNCISIEPHGDDDYEINDIVIGERKIISTLEQAISFCLERVPNFCEYFKIELECINLSKEKDNELLTSYKKILEDQIIYIITEIWEESQK